jgi:hypothetical protein
VNDFLKDALHAMVDGHSQACTASFQPLPVVPLGNGGLRAYDGISFRNEQGCICHYELHTHDSHTVCLTHHHPLGGRFSRLLHFKLAITALNFYSPSEICVLLDAHDSGCGDDMTVSEEELQAVLMLLPLEACMAGVIQEPIFNTEELATQWRWLPSGCMMHLNSLRQLGVVVNNNQRTLHLFDIAGEDSEEDG